jgi:hypothetical protein
MQVLFPKAWAYFKTKQNVLEERNIVGGSMIDRQWYQYGRSQSLTKFTGNKIILPILSLEPRYAYDDQNIVVTGGGNGPYYLVSPKSGDNTDLLFVLTLLCHPLSEAMIRMRTSVFKGGYYSHGKQYIEYLPIPKHSTTDKKEIAELALKAISLKETIGRAKVPQQKISGERSLKQVRKVIEDRISTLFGLSEEEICIIRDIPVPT